MVFQFLLHFPIVKNLFPLTRSSLTTLLVAPVSTSAAISPIRRTSTVTTAGFTSWASTGPWERFKAPLSSAAPAHAGQPFRFPAAVLEPAFEPVPLSSLGNPWLYGPPGCSGNKRQWGSRFCLIHLPARIDYLCTGSFLEADSSHHCTDCLGEIGTDIANQSCLLLLFH